MATSFRGSRSRGKSARAGPDAEVLFVGSRHGLESKLVPDAGFPLEIVQSVRVRRKARGREDCRARGAAFRGLPPGAPALSRRRRPCGGRRGGLRDGSGGHGRALSRRADPDPRVERVSRCRQPLPQPVRHADRGRNRGRELPPLPARRASPERRSVPSSFRFPALEPGREDPAPPRLRRQPGVASPESRDGLGGPDARRDRTRGRPPDRREGVRGHAQRLRRAASGMAAGPVSAADPRGARVGGPRVCPAPARRRWQSSRPPDARRPGSPRIGHHGHQTENARAFSAAEAAVAIDEGALTGPVLSQSVADLLGDRGLARWSPWARERARVRPAGCGPAPGRPALRGRSGKVTAR